jgi:hypothetical protein
MYIPHPLMGAIYGSLICGLVPRLLWGGDLVRWLQPLYVFETMYCSTMLLHLDIVL